MTQNKRLFFEVVAPPFFATLLFLASDRADTASDMLFDFFPALFFVYFLGVFPSLTYALVMEIWFQLGLRKRCGLLGTVGFSGLLGAGAAWAATALGIWLGFITEPVGFRMVFTGITVGLLIGFCVGRKPASAATQAGCPWDSAS